MKATGYKPDHVVSFRPLSPLKLKVLTFYDGWATLRSYVAEKGLVEGLGFFGRALKPYLVASSR